VHQGATNLQEETQQKKIENDTKLTAVLATE
jgi:hypothetical protein